MSITVDAPKAGRREQAFALAAAISAAVTLMMTPVAVVLLRRVRADRSV